jgi:hypothetical protein
MSCRYCYHSDDKHESHCPTVNGEMEQWQAGYDASKAGDFSKEPTVEWVNGRLTPTSNLTFGLGWAAAFMGEPPTSEKP